MDMRTCKAVGRGRSLDRGEEVASVVAGAPPPFTEGLPCMTSHTHTHTNSICPDGTHVLRSLASFESCNAAAECVHHEPHADPDA